MNRQSNPSFFRLQILLVLFTLLNLAVLAQQTNPGSGNNPGRSAGAISHSIRGKIFLPSGNFPEQRMRVVLEISSGGIASEAFSDTVGNFEFRGLNSGTYRVVVPSDARNYDTAQEMVELYGSFSRTVTVQIYLKEKNSDQIGKPNGKVLSAADIQEVPKEARKIYDQGVKLAKNQKPEDASKKFRQALEIFPDYLHALNRLGEQLAALNKSDDARAYFERAIAINSKFALPHINLGMLMLNQNRFDEAVAELEIGNSNDDSYPMGHLNLGLALMMKPQPEFDRAERELLRTLEMGKRDFVHVRKYLFNLNVRRQTMDKAAEQLEAYLREVPEAPDATDVRLMLDKVRKAIAKQKAQAKQ